MKKYLSLVILTVMLLTSLVACNNGNDKDTSSDTASENISTSSSASSDASSESGISDNTPGSPYVNEQGLFESQIPAIDMGGKKFTIIVRGAAAETYQSNDFTNDSELYGDTLNEAVARRNENVCNAYNIELVVNKSDSINSDIRLDVSSGTQYYDAIMPTLPFLATLAQEGSLCDLKTLENIELDAPWWDSNATNAFSINEKCYFTTGDITILNKVNTPSILFNKDYLAELNMESPYDLVLSHKWTYDKMKEMAKAATSDTDGESGMTGADNWGMLSSYADCMSFFGAAGQTICKKDSSDLPYLYIGEGQSISILQQIFTDMSEKGTWLCYAQNFEPPIWVTSLDAFKTGRILFRPSAFSATTKLRIAGTDFGIVPMPLWSEEQDDYCSYCGTGETAGAAILLGCADPEYSARILNAFACEARNTITPAYLEVNLKSKDAQDSESLEMLNIIFDNIIYDIGEVYDFGSIKTAFSGMVAISDTNIVSKMDSLRDTINTKIDEVVASFVG